MKILLAYKAEAKSGGDPFHLLLPVGLGYLNAFLRQTGHHSKLANLSALNWRETEEFLRAEAPGVLGVSQFTHNRFASLRLARLAKQTNPACFVVFGGPHATSRHYEILSRYREVDAVVLGEGETTFTELLRCLEVSGGDTLQDVDGVAFRSGESVTVTPPRQLVAHLDALPMPAAFFDDSFGVDINQQLEFIITSRGCPAACRFCSSPRLWGRELRFRSPRAVVDEIRFIRDHFGLLYFSLRDDTFTADRGRVLEFCRLLLKERVYILWNCQSRVNAVDEEVLFWMKRAGCECVQFGVESGSPRVLKILGKGITPEQVRKAAYIVRRAGIRLSVYLITGVPGEAEVDLRETLSLLDVLKASDGQVSPLAYYPGTKLFEEEVAMGAVAGDLFEANRQEAFYVRTDPFVAHSVNRLLARIKQVAQKNSYGPADFLAQKKVLGYCHSTNIMAGEMFEGKEQWDLAAREYREITDREPENPWGWLMLGELLGAGGDFIQARHAFEELSIIIPQHAPAYSRLGDVCRATGEYDSALRYYKRAVSINPADKIAQEGLRKLAKKHQAKP